MSERPVSPEDIAREYRTAVEEYLSGAGEAALRRAYELGRKSLVGNLGLLEIVHVHRRLAEGLPSNGGNAAYAMDVLAETLSPFEMVLRGYQEANAALRQNLGELADAQEQLRFQNERLLAAHHAVEVERSRYREMFEFAPDAYLVTELDGTIREANTAAASLLRSAQASLPGRSLVEFVSDEDLQEFRLELDQFRSAAVEKREDWQLRVRLADASAVPVAVTVGPERHSTGAVSGLRWLLRDATERNRAEEARAQSLVGRAEAEAARRFAFLAEVSSLLASSLDYESILAAVARLAVPYLADWCFFHVIETDGSVRQLAAPAGHSVAAGATADLRDLLDPHSRKDARSLAELAVSKIVDPVDESWVAAFAGSPEHFQAVRKLGFRSAIAVPLGGRDRLLGVLTLLRSGSGRSYTSQDLALAEDVARRCALALDNIRLYREVLQERDRAERASRAKDDFFAILSHELRSPLTPLLGWTRLLKSRDLIMEDAVLSEGVRSLERNIRHIERLVGDCLDMSRISRGQIRMEKQVTDLNSIVRTSAEAVQQSADEKGLRVSVELSPKPLPVWGDAIRLQQVVMNLLGNAVRYTERGGSVRVCSSESEGEAQVAVSDTGAGIEADDLEQIFEPFNRAANNWLSAESGLGLGLAIVRRIVEMHDGRVWADSEGPGLGSTFYVRIPLTGATGSRRVSDDLVCGTGVSATRLRILLVEDSPDVVFLMRIELEKLGYEVVTASNGHAGVSRAAEVRPDLIISDIKMPGMDGYEFIRRIRAIPELTTVPAIALTGFGMPRDVERALRAGYDASLTKPADLPELDSLIRRLTEKRIPPVAEKSQE